MSMGARKGLGLLVLASCLLSAAPEASSAGAPAQSVPGQSVPGQSVPGQSVPGQSVPAQPPPPAAPAANPAATDPDAAVVQELVVVARDRGPAWWTVSNGTSTVYVLGAPTLAPKRVPWDVTTLQRRLAGANEVILPYRIRLHFARSIGTGWKLMRLRYGGPFEDNTDPATRARFIAARERIGQPASRYKTRNPLAAGLALAADYRAHWNLTSNDTAKVTKVYAEKAKVPIVQAEYDTGPILAAVIDAPAEAGRACLEAVLEQVEAGPGVTTQAANAWARGDTPEALINDRTYERCFYMAPGARAFEARTKADIVAAIQQALTKPGHSVAVVWLPPLLAQGGVLDQLRAKGYQIKTPGEAS
jgi:uncharacterized protein YbaP (TraB family)